MLYGGLYRPVNLVHVPAVSLQRVLVDSEVDRPGQATVTVKARLYNPDQARDALDSPSRSGTRAARWSTPPASASPLGQGEQVLAASPSIGPSSGRPANPACTSVTVTCKGRYGPARA